MITSGGSIDRAGSFLDKCAVRLRGDFGRGDHGTPDEKWGSGIVTV